MTEPTEPPDLTWPELPQESRQPHGLRADTHEYDSTLWKGMGPITQRKSILLLHKTYQGEVRGETKGREREGSMRFGVEQSLENYRQGKDKNNRQGKDRAIKWCIV